MSRDLSAATREALAQFPREQLIDGPTPIQRLHRLEKMKADVLGDVRLFVKRDDSMGFGGGGSKLRKLEFLLGEALARGCDTIVTIGATQSNHARLSAAAAARAGLACELVLVQAVALDDTDYLDSGNVLLDRLFGATLHRVPAGTDALAFAEALAQRLESRGRRPYVAGFGGSSPVGCLGYAACALEIAAQEGVLGKPFARIYLANGSSGTHAGLAAGMKSAGDVPRRIRSFAVLAPTDVTARTTLNLARSTLALLDESATIESDEICVAGDQLGDGYGVPTSAMISAVRLMASNEGHLLDPVYTGKAFAGLMADVERGAFADGDSVLFIMTGGTPGLFAYRTTFEA